MGKKAERAEANESTYFRVGPLSRVFFDLRWLAASPIEVICRFAVDL